MLAGWELELGKECFVRTNMYLLAGGRSPLPSPLHGAECEGCTPWRVKRGARREDSVPGLRRETWQRMQILKEIGWKMENDEL